MQIHSSSHTERIGNCLSLKLASQTLLREKARAASAILGIAAAVALLGWHIELATTALSQAETAVQKATAPYSAWITGPAAGSRPERTDEKAATTTKPTSRATADSTVGFRRGGGRVGTLPLALQTELAASQKTLKAVFVTVQTAPLDIRPGGRVLQGPPLMGAVAAMPENGFPLLTSHVLSQGRWPTENSDGYEAAFNAKLFEDRHVPIPELGSELPMILRNGTVTFKVIGLFRADTLIKAFPSFYTTPTAMAEIARLNPGGPTAPNLALCAPVAGKTIADIEKLLSSVNEAESCVFTTREAVEARFRSDTVANLMKQLPLSLSLAFITAVFMLVTVLTTGIAENKMKIAMLRCVGMTRGGTTRLLVAETAILTLIGWIVGLISATLIVQIFLLIEKSPDLPRLVHLDWRTPALTGLMAFTTALLAALVPCVQASRIRPLDVTDGDASEPKHLSAAKTVLGLALLLPIIACALPVNITPTLRSILMIVIGLPAYVAGSILCLHPLMRFVEWAFLVPIGKLLRLDPRLLSRRLSRAPGRAIGTIMTISLGLGAFIAIHIWGGSLMSSYVPSPEWPDVIVSVLPNGLDADEFAAAAKATGAASPVIPIEASQFPLSSETLDTMKRAGLSAPKSDLVLVFGVDPIKAFGGTSPLANFTFVEGNRTEATATMQTEDACIIPAMLSRITGLHKGDSIGIADKTLKIVGIVDLNWHLVTSRANVRSRTGRLVGPGAGKPSPMQPTVGMAFTSEKVARSLTGNDDKTYFFWLNLSPELAALHPLQATVRLDAFLNTAIDADNSTRGKPVLKGTNALKVHHRDEITDGTIAHGNDIIGTMARIPFWSLIITSSGIAALLIASARASKRETDAMRAIGMTHSQLARIFTGEMMLVILSTLVVSLVGGILIGWSFTAVMREQMGAGLTPVLVIQWKLVGQGVLFAMSMTLVMGAIPLYRITRD